MTNPFHFILIIQTWVNLIKLFWSTHTHSFCKIYRFIVVHYFPRYIKMVQLTKMSTYTTIFLFTVCKIENLFCCNLQHFASKWWLSLSWHYHIRVYNNKHLICSMTHLFNISYKIFEHLVLKVGSSNWVHKTQIHSIQRWHPFGAKTSRSAFLLEKRLHPLSNTGSSILDPDQLKFCSI